MSFTLPKVLIKKHPNLLVPKLINLLPICFAVLSLEQSPTVHFACRKNRSFIQQFRPIKLKTIRMIDKEIHIINPVVLAIDGKDQIIGFNFCGYLNRGFSKLILVTFSLHLDKRDLSQSSKNPSFNSLDYPFKDTKKNSKK